MPRCGQSSAARRSAVVNRPDATAFCRRQAQFAVARADQKDDSGLEVAGVWRMSVQENYLAEHTVGTILRGAFKIYGRHFGTLCLVYILPSIPAMIINQEAHRSGNTTFVILSAMLLLMVLLFAYGAATIAVSDACIGNPPSLKRSYSKILSKIVFLRFVGTAILQIFVLTVGLGLLVIPGLVFALWFMLSPPIVMLEGRSGIAALNRSKQLADGSHWRNAGLIAALLIIEGVIIGIIAIFARVFAAIFPYLVDTWVFRWTVTAIYALWLPILPISLVLVYYDRRVRKEGYDATALAEDLAR